MPAFGSGITSSPVPLRPTQTVPLCADMLLASVGWLATRGAGAQQAGQWSDAKLAAGDGPLDDAWVAFLGNDQPGAASR